MTRRYVPISFIEGQYPALESWLETIPSGRRSSSICEVLEKAIANGDKLDRIYEMVRQLSAGTPMQTVVESVTDDDLPDDVLSNLAGLG